MVYKANMSLLCCSTLSGHHYLRQDVGNDKLHSESIEKAFKELHSEVYAVFSYMDHLYMIKAGTQAHTAQIRR